MPIGTVFSQFQKLFSFDEFYTANRAIMPILLKQSLFKDPNQQELVFQLFTTPETFFLSSPTLHVPLVYTFHL